MKINKVLIAEDEPMLRELLAKICAKELPWAEIRAVSSFKEAEKTLAEFTPDLTISDGSLGDGKGPDLFPRIRAANPRAFILLETSNLRDFPNHGADLSYVKPVMPAQLVEVFKLIEKL